MSSILFKPSYEMVLDSPKAVSWNRYADLARSSLHQLLASGNCDERAYQELLESFPCLLPWCYGTFGGGHHGLVHGAVVTQPRLTGLEGKQPDFLMITRDSASIYAVFVEIESPCKRWFTKQGNPTADLTQAMSQIRSWKAWFQGAGRFDSFSQDYRIPFDFRERRLEFKYLLIYGRREELQKGGHAHLRSLVQQDDERIQSFDHLEPNQNLSNAITTRITAKGYEAVSIPPTLQLGPFQASDFSIIRGKESVVDSSPDMPPDRGAFLRKRFPYWDAWAEANSNAMRSFDVE